MDSVEHAGQVGVDVVLPEAEHAKAGPLQHGIAFPVRHLAVVPRVAPTVRLDDDPMAEAGEIDNDTEDRGLAAEVEAVASPGPEMHPELYFLRRHGLAQGARSGIGHSGRSTIGQQDAGRFQFTGMNA
jgi:hypothetical protein